MTTEAAKEYALRHLTFLAGWRAPNVVAGEYGVIDVPDRVVRSDSVYYDYHGNPIAFRNATHEMDRVSARVLRSFEIEFWPTPAINVSLL